MNIGLFIKALRETWPLTLLCAIGLLIFEILVTYVFWEFQDELSDHLFQVEIVQRVVESLLGSELGGQLDPRASGSIAWVHPVVLAILWAHEITFATRLPAGETDRGTIDVLFGLPVGRWEMFVSESAAWMMSALVLILCAVIGSVIGNSLIPEEGRAIPMRTLIVLINLLAMYFAVGGMAWLVSSFSTRRGWAVAVAFAIVLCSFFLNFLVQFWSPARAIEWLSVLDYYKPMPIVKDGTWPVGDLIVLGVTGAALWTGAGIAFLRRDICTV